MFKPLGYHTERESLHLRYSIFLGRSIGQNAR